MPNQPLIIAGFVYIHGTKTIIEGAIVSAKLKRTNEIHSGSETAYPELVTNSAGEWQLNLANFTDAWQSGDTLILTLDYNGLKDYIEVTLTQSTSNIILTPCPREVYDFERALDNVGNKIYVYKTTDTLDSDYGSIETETIAKNETEDNTYASVQIEEDNMDLKDEGIVSRGKAKGFLKVRYTIMKDNIIRSPTNSTSFWRVMNKPILIFYKNEKHHYEANLERDYSVEDSATEGILITNMLSIEKSYSAVNYGSSCTGSEGATSRALTITTTAKPFSERIFVDGMRVASSDYSITFNNTSIVIIFTGIPIWNTQKIVVDYSTY